MKMNPATIAVMSAAGLFFVIAELTGYAQSDPVFFYLMLYIAAGQGLNLMFGYTGYLPFGNIGFYSIGQYVTGLIFFHYGIHPAAGILLSIIASILFALLLYPTLRLKGIYFAIASFLISEAVISVIVSLPYEISGGSTGISLVAVYSQFNAYYAMLVVMLLSLAIVYIVDSTKIGLALRAIKENTAVSEMLGVEPTKYKLMAWLVNASLVGACGSISAWHSAYVSFDTAASPIVSLNILFFPILGGSGTVLGPLLGSLFYVPLGILGPVYVSYFLIVYGMTLVLVTLFAPQGLIPMIRGFSPMLQKHLR